MHIRTYSPILFNTDDPAGATPVVPTDPGAVEAPGGQGEPTNSMYSQYLESVPEALRSQVEPAFKKWDADVTQKFQAHAEQVKTWEPYAELGIQDINPEDMGHLKTFYEIAADPDAFKEWVSNAYKSLHGDGTTEAPDASTPSGDPAAAGEPQYLTAEQANQLFEQRQNEAKQAEETQRIHDEIAGDMRSTYDALKQKHGEFDEDLVAFLANRDHGDAPTVKESLEAGHAAMLKMFGKVESDALDTKLGQPAPAVTAGAAHSAPTVSTSFDEAKARTRARLSAA